MSTKRSAEDDASHPTKKVRTGFQVGPQNLPDGAHKRKVVKIKKDIIQKAKIKKSYAKLKAREPVAPSFVPEETELAREPAEEPATQELHPERQQMLDTPEETSRPRGTRKPGYFDKEKAIADRRKAEAEARRKEFEQRALDKKTKTEERERFRKAMAKARTGGRNGQRKLGRESKILLEKVKRIVGE